MEWCPLLQLCVVAIEKGAFVSLSITVANYIFYMYKDVFVFIGNHFKMRLLNLRIDFSFIADFLPSFWYFFVGVVSSHYVSARFSPLDNNYGRQ